MKYVFKKEDLPNNKHYAVLVFRKEFVPGDERSVTNPGHGYPAHYVNRTDYISFDSQKDLSDWILRNREKEYSVVVSVPAKVTIQSQVLLD